ncbi:hypothetical protein GQ44DRAFT_830272 [Phaeosphaeriaceae sp. PMI808]|nr:hypothetical protein GQ44DRAFT_830272 [Phaeosphaeriaceae sp. PMI808]
MSIDTQSIIALVALLISCPPTMWLLYALYAQRRSGYGGTILPTHIDPIVRPSFVVVHRQQSRMWSMENSSTVSGIELTEFRKPMGEGCWQSDSRGQLN